MNKINLLNSHRMFANIKKLKKIDPQKLGYVCADGTINFQTPNIALEYAKNRVVAPLRQKEPFERLVLIDKSRIIKEVDGLKNEVPCDTKNYNFDTFVHGHPDCLGEGKTLPLSLDDIVLLYKNAPNGAKRTIAYNSRGEYSMLERKEAPMKPEEIPEMIREYYFKDFNNKCLVALYNFMDEVKIITKEKWTELRHSGKLKDILKDLPEGDFFDQLQIKLDSLILHKAIKDNCEKFGAIYKTNFSNFVN